MIRSPAGFDGGDRIKRYLDYYQPSYGVMMLSAGQFSPALLFAAGEQGAWYDPSDFSTMFQDSAGTTPVTAVEQPVGLILDKSKGLVLGSELVSNPGPFTATTGWATEGTSLTASGGTLNAVSTGAVGGLIYGGWLGSGSATLSYFEISVTITALTGRVRVQVYGSNSVGDWITAPGTYTLRLNQTSANGNVGLNTDQAATVSVSSFSVKKVSGNHASQTTNASRPVLKQDSGYKYLLFDGNDDSLSTPSINFTSTDKMTIWAGSRWQSNFGIFIETSANAGNTNGTLYWYFDSGYGPPRFGIRGTTSSKSFDVTPGITAPVTTVFQNSIDLATGTVTARQNAASATLTASGSTSSGSFANQPLYIGRRGNVDLPFNGRLYSLIMRGTTSTDTEIASTETWVNGKTGAY